MKLKTVPIKKYLSLLLVIVSLSSCGFLSKKNTEAEEPPKEVEKAETPKTIDDYTDNYTITPNKAHPKFAPLMAEFKKQKHRFEIDACEFKYNDQSFFIGDSEEKVLAIFGEPDGGIRETISKKKIFYSYELLKFVTHLSVKEKTITNFSLRMSSYKGHKDTPYDVMLFMGIPYQLDMTLNEFMELSDLNHDKLRHDPAAFFIREKCFSNKEECIYISIAATPSFNNTSIGAGHMTVTEIGDFNPEMTGKIERFSISIETLEELNKE